MRKRRRLKKWVKVVLGVAIFLWLMILNFSNKETTKTTPNGDTYTCKGRLVKVCNGDTKAYKYFE